MQNGAKDMTEQDLLSSVACNNSEGVARACGAASADEVGKALKLAVFQRKDIAIVHTLLALNHTLCLTPVLLTALQRNNLEAFEAVLNKANPLDDRQRVVHEAVMYGYLPCVQQLLKHSCIDTYAHQLLAQASYNGHAHMVDFLSNFAEPREALAFLEQERVSERHKSLLVEIIKQQQLRQTLINTVNDDNHPTKRNKI